MFAKDVVKELKELSEWFDNPKKSPRVLTEVGRPSQLLMKIARELEMKIETNPFEVELCGVKISVDSNAPRDLIMINGETFKLTPMEDQLG